MGRPRGTKSLFRRDGGRRLRDEEEGAEEERDTIAGGEEVEEEEAPLEPSCGEEEGAVDEVDEGEYEELCVPLTHAGRACVVFLSFFEGECEDFAELTKLRTRRPSRIAQAH